MNSFAGLTARLPTDIRTLLQRVCRTADVLHLPIWLVGGAVRDLLLGLPVGRDIDIALTGDPAQLARALAADAEIVIHPRFLTATLTIDGISLDLIRTRRERYAGRAALPDVEPSDIIDDLRRRDFSLNAIALRLALQDGALQFSELIDPVGGRADLHSGTLRLLHARSLIDDPTRLLRGVRLAARLQLRVEAQTAAWISDAVSRDLLAAVSQERLVNELCLLLDEDDPGAVIERGEAWGLRRLFCRSALGGPLLQARLKRFAAAGAGFDADERRLISAGLIVAELSDADLSGLLQRLNLPRRYRRLFEQLPALRRLLPELRETQRPSRIDALLQPYEAAACAVVHYAAPPGDPAGVRLADYLYALRPCRAPLSGDDLRRLGVMAGPALGACLRELRAAVLDGEVLGETAARAWVLQRLTARSAAPDS